MNPLRPASPPRSHLEASAGFTITAPHLAALHDSRLPQELAGDHRTSKSNAMKHPHGNRRSPIALNPNRGATRIKKLGVWEGCMPGHHGAAFEHGWNQAIRIERWRLHDRLAQHFLICPRCGRKQLKLLMPLALEQEIEDARLAEGWVRLVDAYHRASRVPMPRDFATLRARLVDRYCLLFQAVGGRELRCRRCLQVRYGEIKPKRHARRVERLLAARAAEDARRQAHAQAQSQAEADAVAAMFASIAPSPADHDGADGEGDHHHRGFMRPIITMLLHVAALPPLERLAAAASSAQGEAGEQAADLYDPSRLAGIFETLADRMQAQADAVDKQVRAKASEIVKVLRSRINGERVG